MTILIKILITIMAYLFGSIPTAYLLYKIKKGDKINTLTILRIGEDANAFKADQVSFDAAKKR